LAAALSDSRQSAARSLVTSSERQAIETIRAYIAQGYSKSRPVLREAEAALVALEAAISDKTRSERMGTKLAEAFEIWENRVES
jgi:hypothetical protein